MQTSTTTCIYGAPVALQSDETETGGYINYYDLSDAEVGSPYPVSNTTHLAYFRFSTSTCVTESDGYVFDVGSSVMIGGLIMIIMAYWFIGLTRSKSWKS